MSEQTYWNGAPADCRRVRVLVGDDGQFPEYWAREEGLVGTEVDAVEVHLSDALHYLYDGDGSAWRKVTVGQGSPMLASWSLTVDRVVALSEEKS